MSESLGKKFEKHFADQMKSFNYCYDRLKDDMSGWKGSGNVCDFTVFYKGHLFYIECKAIHGGTFNYKLIRDNQYFGLLEKSKFENIIAGVLVWFVDKDVTVFLPIDFIKSDKEGGVKSFNPDKEIPAPCTLWRGTKKITYFNYDLQNAFINMIHKRKMYGY